MRNCNNLSGGTSLDVFFIWSINLGLKYFWSDQLSICGWDISPLTNIFIIYQILCHVSQESVCTIDRLFLFRKRSTHLTYKIHEPLSKTQKQSVHISSISIQFHFYTQQNSFHLIARRGALFESVNWPTCLRYWWKARGTFQLIRKSH